MTQIDEIYKHIQTMFPSYMVRAGAPSDIALLTEILQIYEGDPWLRITNIELTKACKVGDNFMSTVQRAHVEFVRSNSKKKFQKYFILKRQMESTEQRLFLMSDKVWANEAHTYFIILPRLRRHCTTELPHPKLYFSDEGLMILEDLREKGYAMADRLLGLDLEHSILVMKTLALFHSSSFAIKILDAEMYELMKENLKHPYNSKDGIDLAKTFMTQTLGSAKDLYKYSVDEKENKKFLPVLDYLEENHPEILEFLLSNSCNTDFCVMIHGDFWINNMLFAYENESKTPTSCKFVDFQGTRMASAALDLLQFIYSSVQPEVRKKHYNLLMKTYFDTLIANLKAFVGTENAELIKKIEFKTLEDEIDLLRIYGLINAVMLLPIITNEVQINGNSPNGSKDLNVERPYEQSYKARMSDVLEEYVKNGWI